MSVETNPPTTVDTSPFADVFFTQVEDNLWIINPHIQDLQAVAHRRCVQEKICAHDLPHSMRVTQNAFVLYDMLLAGNLHTDLPQNIKKNDLAFAIHLHDLGYGANDDVVKVEGKEVVGHENASWQFLMQRMQEFPYGHPTRRYFVQQYKILHAGILGTDESYDILIHHALENPTANNLFALLVSAADKADYFTRDRVDQLSPPANITTNPYHALAYAVEKYNLSVDIEQKKLKYSVQFYDTSSFSKDKLSWYEKATQECPQVFALLEAVAYLAGYEFIVDIQ